MTVKFAVEICSHHFTVTGFGERGHRDLEHYSEVFEEWQYVKRWGGTRREMIRRYVGVNRDQNEYRFHINALNHFKQQMGVLGYIDTDFMYKTRDLYLPKNVEFDINPKFIERENQTPQIQHVISPGAIKLIELATGEGKTFSTLKAMALLGQRFGVVVKKAFLQRWLDDLVGPNSVLRLTEDDVVVVQGTRHLQDLISLAREGSLDIKAVVISSGTLFSYYKHYETFQEWSHYGAHPDELWELLKLGSFIRDETHLDFHNNFRQDLYSNIPKTVSLTATLITKQPFLRRMYFLMFPTSARTNPGEYNVFRVVKAMHYGLRPTTTIRTSHRGMSSYSHTAFEESVMKRKDVLQRYLEMIADIVKEDFMNKRKHGQKMLILMSCVQMCEHVAGYLAPRFKSVVVKKYNDGDPYEDLINSDISVSTYGKAGTAVDIKGLITVLLTINIDEIRANLQIFGRLRKPADYPETVPEFLYLVCDDIDKMRDYHENKVELFKGKCLSHSNVLLPNKL